MDSGKKAIDQAILRLTSQNTVPDQATLLALLAREGFSLTQGTLSRRLAKLSVRKKHGRYQRVSGSAQVPPPYALAPAAPNLLVLQTHHGLGPALAQRVDRSTLRGVAGTVAGEDSLFVALHGGCTLEEVAAQLEELLGAPQEKI